jgi:two-component system copper resistance phosphate regulon response regulator CusR
MKFGVDFPINRGQSVIGQAMHALIIEDEPKTAAYLRQGLSENGFVVQVSKDGEDGLHQALTTDNDLIVLDVMLPKRDGWSVLSALRKAGNQTPVLFLTARDQVQDRVRGLEIGADDYLGLSLENGQPAPLVDVLHRTLWLMEKRPNELPAFLRDSQVNREQLRLVAPGPGRPRTEGRRVGRRLAHRRAVRLVEADGELAERG